MGMKLPPDVAAKCLEMALPSIALNVPAPIVAKAIEPKTLMTEAQFQAEIIKFAKLHGWTVAHFRPGWNKHGSRRFTAVSADGKGWPDLFMANEHWGRVIVAEVKSRKGTLKPEQRMWLRVLSACGLKTQIWRPKDWPLIVEILTNPNPQGAK